MFHAPLFLLYLCIAIRDEIPFAARWKILVCTFINQDPKKMTKFQIFNHKVFGEIRTVTNEKGETFFVGKDVAKALGYKDTSDALKKHVDADDKLSRQIADSGQRRNTIFINESGLYALILSSKLEQARAFKRARQVHHGGCQEGETAAGDGQGKGWQHGEHMEEAMLCGTDGRWQFPEER